MMIFTEHTYNWLSFIIVTVLTIILFSWLFKRKIREKMFYLTFVFFLWVYAGVGYGWDDCPEGYIWPYILYMFTLSITLAFSNHKHQKINNSLIVETGFKRVLDRYGKYIILFYLILCLLELVVAGKIMNLIHPPSADLSSLMDQVTEGKTMGGVENLLFYIKSIVNVFYLLSLYKYKDDLIKFSACILLPIYISFANTGYVSRGSMMLPSMIILIAFCLKYPQYRRKITIGLLSAIPFIMLLLYWYSMFRIGRDVDLGSISISDAMTALTFQETSYPTHYAELSKWNYNSSLTFSYLTWLVNLPLPGFMKIGEGDFSFNVIFSEKISGAVRGMDGFYVQLPGIVNESIFIFGPVFYFIHAVILGIILSKVYKLLRYDFEIFLLIHVGFSVAYQLGRAGTTAAGVYPFFFKHLLIYLIVRYLFRRAIIKKSNYKINENYQNEKSSIGCI